MSEVLDPRRIAIAEAEDINDEAWDTIFDILRKAGCGIYFADGDIFNIVIPEKGKK